MFKQAMSKFVVKMIFHHFNFWAILNLQLMIPGENNAGSLEEERLVSHFSEQEKKKDKG